MKTLLILIFCIASKLVYCQVAQQQASEFLTDRLTYHNYGIISIVYNAELYKRFEVNIMYISENRIKIHSIIREPNSFTDTTFFLSGNQLMFIDRFEKDLKADNLKPHDIIYAGTLTKFEIIIDDSKTQIVNKVDYSLLKELLAIE